MYIDVYCFLPFKMEELYTIAVSLGEIVHNRGFSPEDQHALENAGLWTRFRNWITQRGKKETTSTENEKTDVKKPNREERQEGKRGEKEFQQV